MKVLRSLHFQNPQAQGKLVHVLAGEVIDVALDLRQGSPSFGRWHGPSFPAPISISTGFRPDSRTVFASPATEPYAPEHEKTIRWDDPDLTIDCPSDQQRPVSNPGPPSPQLCA